MTSRSWSERRRRLTSTPAARRRARSYRYRLFRRRTPSPFEARRSWWYPRPLERGQLDEAAALLQGEHDFRAFTPTAHGARDHSPRGRGSSLGRPRRGARVRDHSRQLSPTHGPHAGRDDARGSAGPVCRVAPRPSERRRRHDRTAVGPVPRARHVLTARSDVRPPPGRALPGGRHTQERPSEQVLRRSVPLEPVSRVQGGGMGEPGVPPCLPTGLRRAVGAQADVVRPRGDVFDAMAANPADTIGPMATRTQKATDLESRAAELRAGDRAPSLPLSRSRRPGDLRRRVRPSLRRAQGARGRAPRARDHRLAHPPRRSASLRAFPEGSSIPRRWGRSRRSPPRKALRKWADDVRKRLGTDEPIAFVTEPKIDGSAVNLIYERRRVRPRRHPRRRVPRRGGHHQPPHDPGDLPAHACCRTARNRRRSSRSAARSTSRSRVPQPLNERFAAEGKRLHRTRATPLPARFASSTPRSRPSGPLSIWVHGMGHHEGSFGRRTGRRSSGSASAASARTRSPSATRRSRASTKPAASGKPSGSSSTTRSTGSWSRSTASTSSSGWARCTTALAGRVRSSGRR